jgi:parallel beta-helix repeat protein
MKKLLLIVLFVLLSVTNAFAVASGINAGEAIGSADLALYLKEGKFYICDPSNSAKMPAVAVSSAAALLGAEVSIYPRGPNTNGGWTWSIASDQVSDIYVGAGGTLVQGAPTTSGFQLQRIASVLSATMLDILPTVGSRLESVSTTYPGLAPKAPGGTTQFLRSDGNWGTPAAGTPDMTTLSVYNVKSFGAVGNGSTDDTAAIQACIDAVASAGGGVVWFAKGNYKITSGLTLTTANPISLVGAPGARIFTTSASEFKMINFEGYELASSALTTSASKGSNYLVSNLASSLSAGNMIRVYDTAKFYSHAARTNGELLEVESVSDTTIYTKTRLSSSYTNSTTTLYKVAMPKFEIDNLELQGNANLTTDAIWLAYSRGAVVKNCRISDIKEKGIVLQYCSDFLIHNNNVVDIWNSSALTDRYGINIPGGQRGTVTANKVVGGFCGISLSGNLLPNRYISIVGNFIDSTNVSTSVSGGCNVHANSEHIVISSNTIMGGISANCPNLIITGNTISAFSWPGLRYYPETNSDYLVFTNNSIDALAQYGIFYNPSTSTAYTQKSVNISNNFITSTTGYGIVFAPYSENHTNHIVTDLVVTGNTILNAGTAALAFTTDLFGAHTANTTITRANISNNTFINSAAGAISLVPKNTSGLLRFHGNTVIGSGASGTITWPTYWVFGNQASHAFTLSGTAYSDNGSGVLAP